MSVAILKNSGIIFAKSGVCCVLMFTLRTERNPLSVTVDSGK